MNKSAWQWCLFLEENCIESNKACLQWSGIARVRQYLFRDNGSNTPAFYMVSCFCFVLFFMLILKHFPKEISTIIVILQLEKYWLCVFERERKRRVTERTYRCNNRKEKDRKYVLGWAIKTAGIYSQCFHVCCCREVSWVEFVDC